MQIPPSAPDLDDIFEPILDDLLLVKNSVGQVYWPAYGIDDIGQWQVGEAYQVYLTAPCTLTYPPNE